MPHHVLHEQKKYKNYTMLAVLLGIIVLFFVLTIVKIQEHAHLSQQSAPNQEVSTDGKSSSDTPSDSQEN
jgi:hypothetical protein